MRFLDRIIMVLGGVRIAFDAIRANKVRAALTIMIAGHECSVRHENPARGREAPCVSGGYTLESPDREALLQRSRRRCA